MKLKQLVGLLTALLVGSSAFAAVFVDQADLALSVARATNYPSVVAFSGLNAGTWYATGGANLIPTPSVPGGPRWLIGAAHQGTFNNAVAWRVTVKTPDGQVLERGYVDRIIIHPQWGGQTGKGVDLMLLRLTNALSYATPCVIHSEPLPDVVLMDLCGFGRFAVAGGGPGTYDGKKRAGCNMMGDIWSPWIESQYKMCNFTRPGNFNYQPGEWQLSDLDSGCGGFVRNGSQSELAAVLCFYGPSGNLDFGSSSGVLPIAPYLPWVFDTINAVENPRLTVRSLGNSQLEISWPSLASEFVLQTSCDCQGWVNTTEAVSDDGQTCSIVVTNIGGSKFWKLARQTAPGVANVSANEGGKALTPKSTASAASPFRAPLADKRVPDTILPSK